MRIISERQRIESVTFEHFFQWNNSLGEYSQGGFGFPCNEDGEYDIDAMHQAARQNMAECLFGGKDVTYQGIQRFEHSYSEPAIGQCPCGCEVSLDSFTNTCEDCGRDYNMSGQELACRSQWGEETGESLSDILSIP